MAVVVSSQWCDSSVAQSVNDSWVLDLIRPATTAKKAKTSCVNKMADFIAQFIKKWASNFGLWIAPKCVWRPGSARTRCGSYSCPPDRLDVIREGRKGKGRKGLGIGREEKEVIERSREGRKGVGRDGKGEGRTGWKWAFPLFQNCHYTTASSYVMHAVYCKFTLYSDCKSWLLS